jgi:hypothetical protein
MRACAVPGFAADAPANPEKPVELPSVSVSAPRVAVELPPITVEASREQWRIIEPPGFQVLYQCPDRVAARFVADYTRFYTLLHLVLQDRLRVKVEAPEEILIYNQDTRSQTARQILKAIPKNSEVKFAPNLTIRDKDYSTAMFMSGLGGDDFFRTDADLEITTEESPAGGGAPQPLALIPEDLGVLMAARAPRPPFWFIDGFLCLYDSITFRLDRVILPPMTWISKKETESIKRYPERVTALLPLNDVFVRRRPNEPAATAMLRRYETALFIRFCLDSEKHQLADRLWQFVAEASRREPDDAMFAKCFGTSEAEAIGALQFYLRTAAVRKAVEIKPENPVRERGFKPRDATPAEVARIKGDWQRLEIGFVRERFPQLASMYADVAQRTLMQPYNDGERDPGLLAVIGLYECDVGNYSIARGFLESAARARVVRPRVYSELARMLLDVPGPRPDNPQGRMNAGEAARVMELLNEARSQSPPMFETYVLFCRLMASRDLPLSEEDLQILDEGLNFFPDSVNLSCLTASAEGQKGRLAKADETIDRALSRNPDQTGRDALESLRRSLH